MGALRTLLAGVPLGAGGADGFAVGEEQIAVESPVVEAVGFEADADYGRVGSVSAVAAVCAVCDFCCLAVGKFDFVAVGSVDYRSHRHLLLNCGDNSSDSRDFGVGVFDEIFKRRDAFVEVVD